MSKTQAVQIDSMKVGGVQHLVERAYRESGELQFIRELFKNAGESGASKIEFSPEWQSVESTGTFRLMVADNGAGMDPDQMIEFMNTFGGGGKPIGAAHENFGVGAKTSTLPWNKHGVVVLSWQPGDPDGCMIWLCCDPGTGQYGLRKFETEDGSWEAVVAPFLDDETGIDWQAVKPSWIGDQGTVVVLLGDTGAEHTYVCKSEPSDGFGVKGISAYLNRRFWEIPVGVEVHVQELRATEPHKWPRNRAEAFGPQPQSGIDRRINRRKIEGARHFVEYPASADGRLADKGTLALKDGTEVDWYLWDGKRPRVHSYAHDKGYIAALYDGELYDFRKHVGSFRQFGITQSVIRERLTLIARPPVLSNGQGVYPDTARNTLRIQGTRRAGEPLPWDEWGSEFAHHLPQPIVDALKAAMPSSSGTLEDDKWLDRLASQYGSRWKQPVHRVDSSGSTTTTPTRPGSRPKSKTGTNNGDGKSGGTGATGGTPTKGLGNGPAKAKATKGAAGIPSFEWADQAEFEPGVAAAWNDPSQTQPNGLVQLNRDFGPFQEVVDHWQSLYPPHLGDQIRTEVERVYGVAMVARIAHSETLVRDRAWGRGGVQKLRSPEALTMSALGLVYEDQVISQRLGGLLGAQSAPPASTAA